MDVRAIASLRASVRVGLVIPKYKHNSVKRNRLKRRIRELVRLEWLPVLPPMDVVVRVTPLAYERDFDTLRIEIRKAGDRLALLSLGTPIAASSAAVSGSTADTDTKAPAAE
jgi:ribonuclease P protein component